MRHFCTYFDSNFLVRGLALYQSLESHGAPFTLWVLGCDDAVCAALPKLNRPNLRVVPLAALEKSEPTLETLKNQRSRVEYLWTLSPLWPLYLLNNYPDIEQVTYLDADLYFFGSPEAIFEEMGVASILIIAHRFPEHLKSSEVNGIYNVGLLSFRNDARGRECLEWWRERCLEWCHDYVEGDKYGDQRYLDSWPRLFEGVHVLRHTGAGLAPWNWVNYDIRATEMGVMVDEVPLIFYHFHGMKFFNSWLYDPVLSGRVYGEMPPAVRDLLFSPYLDALRRAGEWARESVPEAKLNYTPVGSYGWRIFLSKLRRGKLALSGGLR